MLLLFRDFNYMAGIGFIDLESHGQGCGYKIARLCVFAHFVAHWFCQATSSSEAGSFQLLEHFRYPPNGNQMFHLKQSAIKMAIALRDTFHSGFLETWNAPLFLHRRGRYWINSSPLMPYICISEWGQRWFRWWFVAYLAPSQYLN